MLEHVPEPASVIEACATLLAGRTPVLSTLNRTPAAFAVAIVGAEYLARLLPKGQCTTAISSSPPELAAWLRDRGWNRISGLAYEPWRNSADRVAHRREPPHLYG